MSKGTTLVCKVKLLVRQIENTLEVTEYELNGKWSLKPTSGPISADMEFHFESVAGGTKVSLVGEAKTGGFFKLGEPIVDRMLQRQYDTNLTTLKDLQEAQVFGSD